MHLYCSVALVSSCERGEHASLDSESASAGRKPKAAACKAELKEWSTSNLEMLTIAQLQVRMTETVSCAKVAEWHRHSDKRVTAYLLEFYRTDAELASRAFDFINEHHLSDEFREQKDGVASYSTDDPDGSAP